MSLLRSTTRLDASRPPARSIGELPGDRVTISPDLPVFDVERMFLAEPTLSAMVVCDHGDAVCISRDWFFAQLVGPLGHGRSLYARHRIGRLPRPDTLMLPASTTPVEAAREVQTRPADSRYHDVVVSFADGSYGTVSVADLFAEVAHTHAYVGLHDPLTGLANRRLFLERLGVAHRHHVAGETAGLFGVLFVDLDDFKPINDVFGHETGDVALVTVAQRLRRFEDRPVTVARFGGDEFGVLIEDAESADAIIELAERIAPAMSAPMLLGDERITLSASIGVAIADGRCAPADLLRNADLAMYTAKRDSKGGYALYEAEMHARASKRLQLRSQLEVALEQGQFALHFQPMVELEDRRVVGAEALVRWQQPDTGLVGPNHFIPFCEQTGMIVPLGSWVLRQACEHGVRWSSGDPADSISLSVNISPHQLLEPGFVDGLATIIAETGIDTGLLILEITENVFIEDVASVTARLEAIRRLGVRIALDDFGTGFSSLGYLARLPIDVLKLDRSFVSSLHAKSERALFHGIVELAHSLELVAVAEGVETPEQLSVVRGAGCDRGQGYLFARPMDAERMTALLEQQRLSSSLRSVA